MTKTPFKNLPQEVQAEVIADLEFFRSSHVSYENGRWSTIPAVGVKATYAPDHKYHGEYNKADIK